MDTNDRRTARTAAGRPTGSKPHVKSSARSTTKNGTGLLPIWLILLSAIPIIGGTVRLVELAGGAAVTPANARFFASPAPVVIHIVSAVPYAVLGAFQFSAGFRNRLPAFHRWSGRVLLVLGLAVALSGLWMTVFYPLPSTDGALLFVLRLVFGWGMFLALVLGYADARRGEYRRHGDWMARAYAIGVGAGTQAFTQMAGELLLGPPNAQSKALLMGLGWLINLSVAEWSIRRRKSPRTRKAAPVASGSI